MHGGLCALASCSSRVMGGQPRRSATACPADLWLRITFIAQGDTLLAIVKTLRLDPELQERLQRAAAVTGESLSEFIRRAAAQRADALLNSGARDDFADVLGVIHGGGGRARRTGEAFTAILGGRERNA